MRELLLRPIDQDQRLRHRLNEEVLKTNAIDSRLKGQVSNLALDLEFSLSVRVVKLLRVGFL